MIHAAMDPRRAITAALPVCVVAIAAVILWYAVSAIIGTALLPRPDQVATTLGTSVFDWPITSPPNLLYHAGVTAEAALVVLAFAVALGVVIAVGIVHFRVLDRSLMPW